LRVGKVIAKKAVCIFLAHPVDQTESKRVIKLELNRN